LGTNVLSLQYDNSDPHLAVQIVNALIDAYNTYLKDSEQASHRGTIGLLTDREKALRSEMSKLHADYEKLRAASPLMGQDRDSAGVQRAMLMTLGDALTTVKRQQIELQNVLSNLTTRLDDPIAEQRDDSLPTHLLTSSGRDHSSDNTTDWQVTIDAISRMAREGLIGVEDPTPTQQALLEARSRDAELSTRFGPKHPDVRGAKQTIKSLEARLIKMVSAAPRLLATELETLQRNQESLTELYKQEFNQAKSVDSFLVKEQQLLDEINTVQTTHDTIVAQLNTFRLADQAVTEGRASVTVSVLDGPELVNNLVWPQPIPLLGLCVMIGGAGGIVLTGVRQQLQFPSVGTASTARVGQLQ